MKTATIGSIHSLSAVGNGGAARLLDNGRYDMYLLVHKGLRAFMTDVLVRVGVADSADDDEMQEVATRVRELLDICRSHLEHENDHVHAAMEARRPGSSGETAAEHVAHERAIADLEIDLGGLQTPAGTARAAALTQLYRRLALFVADNFVHMHAEETHNNAVLWECYTDDELRAIEQRLVASVAPQHNAVFLRWMAPHVTPAERARLFGNAKQHAPAEVFGRMLASVKPHLSNAHWNKLTEALGP